MSKESFLGRLFLLFLGVTILVLRIYKRVIFLKIILNISVLTAMDFLLK